MAVYRGKAVVDDTGLLVSDLESRNSFLVSVLYVSLVRFV